jgi:hypothetical protein
VIDQAALAGTSFGIICGFGVASGGAAGAVR